jgi:hypothetical protein
VLGIGGGCVFVCVCVCVCAWVCVCVCIWLIFNFLSMLMDVRTENTMYESAAHSVEIYFAWHVLITVPIPRTQYSKTLACGNPHAACE